jgi:hypothetical protein
MSEIACVQECPHYQPRVFENRMLRRIFGSKRDELIGGWRKMLN